MEIKAAFDLDSQIVRVPEYYIRLKDDVPVRLHVSRAGGSGRTGSEYDEWQWAVLLRVVGGWEVVAGSVLTASETPVTHAHFAQTIADRYGDGYARMAPEDNCVARATGVACLYSPDGTLSWCGAPVRCPAVFDRGQPGHVEQHCTHCTTAYRAAHYGRTPITH